MNDVEGSIGRPRPRLRDRPWWKLLVSSLIGVFCLVASGVCGVLAVQDFAAEQAYRSAVPCGSATTTAASCLTDVTATVTAVSEVGGQTPSYQLGLSSRAGAVTVSFPGDNVVLGYAADGSTVTAEYWRGKVVSVTGQAGSATTTDAPPLAFARNLGGTLFALSFALYALLVAWVAREQPRRAPGSLGPLGSFVVILVGIGGLVPMVCGWHLFQNPTALHGTLVAGGCALVVVVGLAGWAAVASRRRRRREAARRAGAPSSAAVAPAAAVVPQPRAAWLTPALTDEIVLLARPTRRQRARAVDKGSPRPVFETTRLFGWGGVVLFALLFFAAFITLNDGPNMRAYDSAPACPAPATSPGCRGLVPVLVDGVRAATGGGEAVDISFATADGAVNAWNQFDSSALTRQAQQLQQAETVIPAQVWGDRVLGVQLDGTMHWAQGDPPDDSFAAGSLAVLAGLALLLNRARTRFRHPERGPRTGRWLLDDAAQLVLTAAGVWLMAVGIGWGVLPLVGGLGWSQWSVPRAGVLRRRRSLIPALAPPVAPGRDGAPARFADLADEALFLDPADQRTEHIVNSWVFQCPEPGGDGFRAADTSAELEQLASALQTRIAASGRELSAHFVVTVNTRSGRLSCHTVTLSRSELLENDSFEPVDSLAGAVERWLAGPAPELDPDDDSEDEEPRSLLWLREIGTAAGPG